MNTIGEVPSAQRTWVIPQMPEDDLTAVRGLAATYRRLAGALRELGSQLQAVLAPLPVTWAGEGAAAAGHPVAVVLADIDQVCRALDEAAAALDECAASLHKAQEQHRWSWQKIVKVGAIVVVSGAAIYVTAGLAAPEVAAVSSAAISGEVAASEVAVASAVTARTTLSVALSSSGRLFATVRGLGALIRPQLPYAIAFTGADAAGDVADDGQLDVKQVATTFGLNLVLPTAMRGSSQAVRALPALVSRPAAATVAGHVAAGTAVSGLDATRQQILNGRVDRGHVIDAGVSGAVFSSAGDLARRMPWVGRGGPGLAVASGEGAGGAERQRLSTALDEGVDLRAHEGVGLGHTLAKHVGKDWTFLQRRLDTEPGPMKSTFRDEATANTAVSETLRSNRQAVLAFARGEGDAMQAMKTRFDEPLGYVLRRNGERVLGYECKVVLSRDSFGSFILTGYVAP